MNVSKPARGHKTLRADALSLFCMQASLFLRAGMPMLEGLGQLREDVRNPVLQRTLDTLYASVEKRSSLSQAMKQACVFPAYLVHMVHVGEVSGYLEEMLENLTRHYEREEQMRQRIRHAVAYPLILIAIMGAVVFLLVAQVLPMFESLLRSTGGRMPGFVRALMSVAQGMGRIWPYLLGGIFLLWVAYRGYRARPGGRRWIDGWKARCPLTRSVYHKMAAERFAGVMSFLLRSHVPVDMSLDMARDILGNAYMAEQIDKVRRETEKGAPFSEALEQTGLFPRLFTRMIGLGFKTGQVDAAMEKLRGLYEQEVDRALNRLTGAIEPAFVALLSIVVGVILVSVMLPLIQIMNAIG